mmetsp:Transcript_3865/g.2866  ORF Transcript_3865/g.2866 Transcript_3865/m.2866 type:complete len:88 (+) Transcript_3865:169-432(+)
MICFEQKEELKFEKVEDRWTNLVDKQYVKEEYLEKLGKSALIPEKRASKVLFEMHLNLSTPSVGKKEEKRLLDKWRESKSPNFKELK